MSCILTAGEIRWRPSSPRRRFHGLGEQATLYLNTLARWHHLTRPALRVGWLPVPPPRVE